MKKISFTGAELGVQASAWCRLYCKHVWSTAVLDDLYGYPTTIIEFYHEDDAILAILTWAAEDGVHVYK